MKHVFNDLVFQKFSLALKEGSNSSKRDNQVSELKIVMLRIFFIKNLIN